MSWHNISSFICLWLYHNTSHLSYFFSHSNAGTFSGLLPASLPTAHLYLQTTKSSSSSPEAPINCVLSCQLIGKDRLDHFHDDLYSGHPLPLHILFIHFPAKICFKPLCAAEMCLWSCYPNSAPLHTPRLNQHVILQCLEQERDGSSWSALPCGLSSLGPLAHHGLLLDPGRGKRKQNEEGSSFGKTLHSYVICRGVRCRPLTSRLVH